MFGVLEILTHHMEVEVLDQTEHWIVTVLLSWGVLLYTPSRRAESVDPNPSDIGRQLLRDVAL